MKKKSVLHQWECPKDSQFLLKIETLLLAFLVFLVYLIAFFVFNQSWPLALMVTVVFILIFGIVHRISKKIYPIKHKYQIMDKHLAIKHQSGKKETNLLIPFSEIKKFKLDKFIHGGRIELKDKLIPIYFNSRQEVEKLEQILKQKIKHL